MTETNALSITQETDLEKTLALSSDVASPLIPDAPQASGNLAESTNIPDAHESYERATTLKNVGLFRQAAEHFAIAAQDPAQALKSFAQMGLCLKKSGQQEEAVAAFRKALQIPSATSKEQIQILYLLGRTLESLDRISEALEAYRWLRREAPDYRDVALRIEALSSRKRG
jgi:tetratricopeptide (TPR) repeat protein